MLTKTKYSITCILILLQIFLLANPRRVFAAGLCGTGVMKNFICLEYIYKNILNLAIAGGAIASFLVILKGGFSWLTSAGDPKQIESARDTLTYGIAGLALMILIWFILSFLKEFTGVDVTTFEIPV